MRNMKIMHNENSTETVYEDVDGTKRWIVSGKLHREDGPAVEYADGGRWWFFHGALHREDGPAIEELSGYRAWYLNGIKIARYSKG